MKRKTLIISTLLFFCIIGAGLVYFFLIYQWNDKKKISKKIIQKKPTSSIDKNPEPKIIKKPIKQKTSKRIIQKKTNSSKKPNKINIFSRMFLEKTFENFQVDGWKKAVVIEYQQNNINQSSKNDYKIKKINFENTLLEKIFIKAIAQKIDFEDLLITFTYWKEIPQFKIKIAFMKKPKIFIEKKYKIEIKENNI